MVFRFVTYVLAFVYYDVLFFQAEDGIRDLVRSRGLGDVYKRQESDRAVGAEPLPTPRGRCRRRCRRSRQSRESAGSVSYTHLTLPTSDLV